MQNLLRVIVDVYGTPVKILARANDADPLDLTLSQLRSVSPYHIEYLKNLNVGSTTTASLMVNGALWGLIACHHDRRKALVPWQRKAISEIAQTLSSSVERGLARLRRLSEERIKARKIPLQEALADVSAFLPEMLFGRERLRSLLHCCGTAIWSANAMLRMGDAPAAQELDSLASRLLEDSDDIVTVDSRGELAARLGFAPQNSSLAGLVAIVVSREPALILFGFRLEEAREITWGGDINQAVLRNEQTGALGPRRSFARYKQSVLGKAESWTGADLASAQLLLATFRGKALSSEQLAAIIDGGFTKIRALATAEYPLLQHSFLDAIGSGVSVLFRSDAGEPTLRYVNKTLLDAVQANPEAGGVLPTVGDLLTAIGLPSKLLSQSEFEARQLIIPDTREGFRHFLVERKLALEIRDSIGQVSLSALLFTDTTREERAREALQAAQDRAKHLTLLKSSFLANMSHEIRTPMNGILGMVQLLLRTRTDPEQQRYLEIMQRSGDLMLNLINDILDLSKIEAGRTEMESVPFDLTAVVEGVVDLMRPGAYKKSVGFSVSFDSPPPRLYLGDPFRLRQIILNIVGNAIKFTTAGQVAISVRCEDVTPQTSSITISIADTGTGIPEGELSNVFNKFHQADQSSTRKHSGTGLGLAISRDLVVLMGGTISLASTVGVGSTFTVNLALARASEADQSRATSDLLAANSITQRTSLAGGNRILVAEDDLTNQIVIEEVLKTQGFEVEIADTGLRVLELLAERSFDLILMDCHMPELDGYQTTARIRSLEGAKRHIPIIALTASALSEDRQRCLNAGMSDYLSKPIEIRTLCDVLKKWNCPPRERLISVSEKGGQTVIA